MQTSHSVYLYADHAFLTTNDLHAGTGVGTDEAILASVESDTPVLPTIVYRLDDGSGIVRVTSDARLAWLWQASGERVHLVHVVRAGASRPIAAFRFSGA